LSLVSFKSASCDSNFTFICSSAGNDSSIIFGCVVLKHKKRKKERKKEGKRVTFRFGSCLMTFLVSFFYFFFSFLFNGKIEKEKEVKL